MTGKVTEVWSVKYTKPSVISLQKYLYIIQIKPGPRLPGLICKIYRIFLTVWGRYPGVDLLDKVQSKAFRLISSSTLTDSLPSLSLRRDVASLSLYYRYYFGRCSVELQSCIPPPLNRPRATRQASQAHQYAVALSQSRIERFSKSFIPSTSVLWNDLSSEVFPEIYDLTKFKYYLNKHFRSIP